MNYKPLNPDKEVHIKYFYLYENEKEKKLGALFLVSKLKGKIFFIDFKNLDYNDPIFENELGMGAQMWADKSVNRYWTKQLLSYLDSMIKMSTGHEVIESKPLKVIKINSLDDIFTHDNEKTINVYEIDEAKFAGIGKVTELADEDFLEMTSKLIAEDKVYKVLSPELLEDLEDSYNWMVENIYDND